MQTSLRIAVVGASGGIGHAIVTLLARRADISAIHATYFRSPPATLGVEVDAKDSSCTIHWQPLDATNEEAVSQWVGSIGRIDWLINCVGMLHDQSHGPEKTIRGFNVEHFSASMAINCMPTLLLGKHALPLLKGSTPAVFATVSARVGSISDNRLGGWYSYRTSKAALNMALKCLAIEWSLSCKNIRVAALHPGTTATSLSEPFQKNVPPEKLFSVEKTAGLLVEQIEQLKNYPSGRFIAYDGEEIPW